MQRLVPRLSLARAVAWVVAIPVAYYFGWLASVTFVAVASLYANAAGDYAAYRADTDERIDDMVAQLDRIEAAVAALGGTED